MKCNDPGCPNEAKKYRKFCSRSCARKQKRTPRFEYVVRLLTKGNKSGDAYGLTLPAELVEKHDLLGKKFKIKTSPKGRLMLYVKQNKR